MKNVKNTVLILKYFLGWLLFCTLHFFLSEEIIKLFFSGVYNVEIWINTVIFGIVFITVIILIFFFISLRKIKKQDKNENQNYSYLHISIDNYFNYNRYSMYAISKMSFIGYWTDRILFWIWLFLTPFIIAVFWRKIWTKIYLGLLIIGLILSILPMGIEKDAILITHNLQKKLNQ